VFSLVAAYGSLKLKEEGSMPYQKKMIAVCLALAACGQPAAKKTEDKKPTTMAEKPSSQENKTDAAQEGLRFVQLLSKADYKEAESKFSPEMKAAVPEGGLQKIWEGFLAQGGTYQKATVSKTMQKDVFNVAIVKTEFSTLTVDLQVVYDVKGLVSGFRIVGSEPKAYPYTAPDYVKPETYEEKEVTVGEGEWALPGTLTIPKGTGPFPAVILVHGSGPQDRDESIGKQKPFKDIALGLATRGIAVLRYEKRTKVYGAKMTGSITLNEETIDDAVLAFALLQKEPNIDPKKIFVAGHSLGGLAIPRIGTKTPQAAGYIILAGPTRPFEDIILDQITYIANLDGTLSEEEKKALDDLKVAVQKVKDPALSETTPASELPMGVVPASYWLDLRAYKPVEVLKTLPQPVLLIQGGRDYQVTLEDVDGWRAAGKENLTVQIFDDLNHTFVKGEGKATPAEYEKEGSVSESVIQKISDWVKSI
jgi:dienelactone hydrolase